MTDSSSNPQSLIHSRDHSSLTDLLAIAFGGTTAMWAVGYVGRLPPAIIPGWVLLPVMLLCLLIGGFISGRYTPKGIRGGMKIGLLSSLLNLLILGSLLGGKQSNQIVPSALLWIPGTFLIGAGLGSVGAALGSLIPDPRRDQIHWLAVFAKIAAVAVFFLLIVGGIVTGNGAGLAVVDWPNSFGYNMFLYPLSRMSGGIYYEHAHRLFGSLVGLTTLILALRMQKEETRPWLRRLAWIALVLVILQGILGGLRVTGRFTLSDSPQDTAPSILLAIAHGILGQVFFALMVSIAVFTTVKWQNPGEVTRKPSAATDHALTPLVVVVLLAQLILGATVRHVAGGLMIHISLAVLVATLAVTCGVRAWGLYETQPLLQRFGLILTAGTGTQICLGIGALIAREGTLRKTDPTALRVLVTTAHQACGALLLACAVAFMLWSFRLLSKTPPNLGLEKESES